MKKGLALIVVMLMAANVLLLMSFLTTIVYSYAKTSSLLWQKTQAFYLAEAGLESGKVNLVKNSSWYTDLAYFKVDDANWLINQAVGQETSFDLGKFKLIREKNKDRLYSIGYVGSGVVILRLKFALSPYKKVEWKQL